MIRKAKGKRAGVVPIASYSATNKTKMNSSPHGISKVGMQCEIVSRGLSMHQESGGAAQPLQDFS